MLAFNPDKRQNMPPCSFSKTINEVQSLAMNNVTKSGSGKVGRRIPALPERILDAPDLVDDYYLNLLDWSKSSNKLAVCLA